MCDFFETLFLYFTISFFKHSFVGFQNKSGKFILLGMIFSTKYNKFLQYIINKLLTIFYPELLQGFLQKFIDRMFQELNVGLLHDTSLYKFPYRISRVFFRVFNGFLWYFSMILDFFRFHLIFYILILLNRILSWLSLDIFMEILRNFTICSSKNFSENVS